MVLGKLDTSVQRNKTKLDLYPSPCKKLSGEPGNVVQLSGTENEDQQLTNGTN